MTVTTKLLPSLRRTAMMKLRRTVGALLIHGSIGELAARLLGNVIPHRGLKVDVSSGLVSSATKAALLLRAYESGEIRFMQKYLPRNCDVVELGGSIGVMSCLIRRRIDKDRRLLVVEADPRLAEILERNLRMNDCDSGTIVETAAIADEGRNSVSFAIGARSDSGRLASGAGQGRTTIEVPAMSLGALLDRHDYGRFCMVSDIEGAEWGLWRNQREALLRADWIILETHDNPRFGAYSQLIAEMSDSGPFELIDRYGPVVVLRNRTVA